MIIKKIQCALTELIKVNKSDESFVGVNIFYITSIINTLPNSSKYIIQQ